MGEPPWAGSDRASIRRGAPLRPDEALALCRFLHDGAGLVLWGAYAFLWALIPKQLADHLGRRLEPLRLAAVAVAVATAVAVLPLEAAVIGEGWVDGINPATVQAVLFETSVGWAWMAQAVVALLLAGTLTVPLRLRLGSTALASGLLLATLTLTGHAAMHEGALGVAHRLNDAVHVLAAGAWLGALVPLLPLLRALDDRDLSHGAGLALRRFSVSGHFAVALVVLTGSLNTMLVLGRWPTDWSSPYQAMLAAKAALVLVMTALALVNRYLLVPMLARSRGSVIRTLREATMIEIALGFAVVGLVSVFGLLEPA